MQYFSTYLVEHNSSSDVQLREDFPILFPVRKCWNTSSLLFLPLVTFPPGRGANRTKQSMTTMRLPFTREPGPGIGNQWTTSASVFSATNNQVCDQGCLLSLPLPPLLPCLGCHHMPSWGRGWEASLLICTVGLGCLQFNGER